MEFISDVNRHEDQRIQIESKVVHGFWWDGIRIPMRKRGSPSQWQVSRLEADFARNDSRSFCRDFPRRSRKESCLRISGWHHLGSDLINEGSANQYSAMQSSISRVEAMYSNRPYEVPDCRKGRWRGWVKG
jgi:hypothetical protein